MILQAFLACALAVAEPEVPKWILPAIAYVETRSYYDQTGSFHYVDKRRGSHGEYGPFQCTRIAFNQIKRHGEQFWRVESDIRFSEEIALRYLQWSYSRSHSWDKAVAAYNPRDKHYLQKVKRSL